jgi:hypothetical protein
VALHTHGLKPSEMEWYDKYFGQLVGGTIMAFKMKVDDSMGYKEYWPTFKVLLPSVGLVEIELSQDEEGNGPGWLFGLPIPEPIEKEKP